MILSPICSQVNLIFPALFLLGCIALVIIPIVGNPKDTGKFQKFRNKIKFLKI
jgi:hypothetical protein